MNIGNIGGFIAIFYYIFNFIMTKYARVNFYLKAPKKMNQIKIKDKLVNPKKIKVSFWSKLGLLLGCTIKNSK